MKHIVKIVSLELTLLFSLVSCSYFSTLNYESDEGAFFNSQKKTLDGEKAAKDKGTANDYVSVADSITDDVYANHLKVNPTNGTATAPSTTTYGEEFFLIYTASGCDPCNETEKGLKYLADHWSNYYNADDPFSTGSSTLRFYTIFTNEESSNDDDYHNDGIDDTAFRRYLGRYIDFFSTTAAKLEDAPYKKNNSIDEANYGYYEEPSFTEFSTPTFLLCDFTQAAIDEDRAGVSEVVFGTHSGYADKDRASLLFNMWNHVNTDSSNPFSSSYKS